MDIRKQPEENLCLVKMSEWFKKNSENSECLLPQNIPDDILKFLLVEAQGVLDGSSNVEGIIVAVGLVAGKEQKTFKASREQLSIYVKSYSFNIFIESLRRTNVLKFNYEFTLENVLDIRFEREFKLTEFGKKAAENAGGTLSNMLQSISGNNPS